MPSPLLPRSPWPRPSHGPPTFSWSGSRRRACGACRRTSGPAFAKRFGTSVEEMATSLGRAADAGARRTLPAASGPRIVVVGLGTGEHRLRGSAASRGGRRTPGREPGARRRDGDRGRLVRPVQRRRGVGGRRGRPARAPTATPGSAPKPRPPAAVASITVLSAEPRQRPGRGGADARRRHHLGPGVGQHAGQPALPGDVRRGGPQGRWPTSR